MYRRRKIDTLTMLIGLVLTGLVITTLAQAAEPGRLPYDTQANLRLPADLDGDIAGFHTQAYARLDRGSAEESGPGLVRRNGGNALALTLDRPGLELVHQQNGYRSGLRLDAGNLDRTGPTEVRHGPAVMFVFGHSW